MPWLNRTLLVQVRRRAIPVATQLAEFLAGQVANSQRRQLLGGKQVAFGRFCSFFLVSGNSALGKFSSLFLQRLVAKIANLKQVFIGQVQDFTDLGDMSPLQAVQGSWREFQAFDRCLVDLR